MKKFFLFLLILAGSFCGALKVSAAWAVTDTIVADGYYYIRLNYCPDATPNPGCVQVRPFQKAAVVGWNGLHIKNMTQISKNDLSCIWHIWRTVTLSITSRTVVFNLRPMRILTVL